MPDIKTIDFSVVNFQRIEGLLNFEKIEFEKKSILKLGENESVEFFDQI